MDIIKKKLDVDNVLENKIKNTLKFLKKNTDLTKLSDDE